MGLNHGWRGPNIVRDGLVLYLDAGSPNSYQGSGTTWKDISKFYQNNGTLVNGPTFNSGNGGSIVFDGVNDYVNVNFSSSISEQSFSVLLFFKNLNTPNWTDFFSLIPNSGSGSLVFERGGENGFPLTNGYLKVYPIASSSLTDIVTPGTFVNDSNNHFFAITANSSNWSLYSESGSYATGSVSGPIYTFNRLTIGTDISRSNRYSKNQTYSIQIYNRALTQVEVLQNYNATKGRFGL